MRDSSRTSHISAGSASAETAPRAPWLRFALPSVSDLVFVVILALLTCTRLSVRLLGDAGIGWHIRAGQMILATHAIPHTDSFSATMSGRPWFAWEWLYDLTVGAVERWAGLNGVVLFTAIVIALVFAGTFRLLVRRGTGLFLALVLVLLSASASMIHFLSRPHVLSWLFTLVWFWILDASERGYRGEAGQSFRQAWLWALPALMLVWVNVHGGFLVGFVLLVIFWLSAIERTCAGNDAVFAEFLAKLRADRDAKNLAALALLCALATLANPYGWKLHVHIYRYLSNRFLMDHIQEFLSPDFHGVAERCFAILLLLALVALAFRLRRLRLGEGLIVLFCAYSGIYASRNIPLASLLLVMVIGPILSRQKKNPGAGVASYSQRMLALDSGLRGHLWPTAALILAVVIAGHDGRLGSKLVMDAHFDASRFPAKAVDYLQHRDLKGPVLSTDWWGGYLIYRLYPAAQVVLDDRHDFYGAEFFKSYLNMIEVKPGWEAFLDEYPAGCVLLPKKSALANVMMEMDQKWTVVYADDVAVAFVKRTQP